MNDRWPHPDGCGCCQGLRPMTPASIENRPGLKAFVYRVGTQTRFRATLFEGLASRLRGLTTRDVGDAALALLDGWAVLLDVLSFYQERIANENYLRTATERRSVLELARAIGYELGPGVAASTYLSFGLETAQGSPETTTVPIGAKAQSVPREGERPQVFETVEMLEAHVAWSEMRARRTKWVAPKLDDTTLHLQGTATQLKPGDAVLLVGDERRDWHGSEAWDFRRVLDVTPMPSKDPAEPGYTIVTMQPGLGSRDPMSRPAVKNPKLFALRLRAGLFGHNAPEWKAMAKEVRGAYGDTNLTLPDWPDFSIEGISEEGTVDPDLKNGVEAKFIQDVHLDAAYPKVVVGSWVVLSSRTYRAELYEVRGTLEDACTGFTLAGKSQRLSLKGEALLERFNKHVRDVSVFAQSELLELSEQPDQSLVGGNTVDVVGEVTQLPKGRLIVLAGTDTTGESTGEVVTLESATIIRPDPPETPHTRLLFTAALLRKYRRHTVVVHGNVARATHGETKEEVLGSGRGTEAFQRFDLKQKPLTYVSAPTATGSRSTLEVRVGGVRWDEAPSLYGLDENPRAYATRRAEDGTVTVIFGGRLPSAPENVNARYRVGTGREGLLEPGQISLLLTRPLGLKSVMNPLAPAGADDPEFLERARTNAPRTVLTLERVVSQQDYEDFARAFAGVGKAQATPLWDGESRLIHLTLAQASGEAVEASSDLRKNLRAALDAARHQDHYVRLNTYEPLHFVVVAGLAVDPAYVRDDVKQAVTDALSEAFSFQARSFGQPVTASEVVAVIQSVGGVVATVLQSLHVQNQSPPVDGRLVALRARWDGSTIKAAQLLTLHPRDITLTEMTA